MSRKKNKDNKANKAFKYRIYPTDDQKTMFAKTFGCCRKVWNLLLGEAKENRKITDKYTFSTPAVYKDEYPYLKEVDSLALANVQMNLSEAFVAHFDKDRKKNNGFPHFKTKKGSKTSYTTNCCNNNIRIVDDKYIRLPKVGNVKAVIHRFPKDDWKLRSVTVSMDKDHKYYASVLFEYEPNTILIKPDENTIESKTLGLDYTSHGLYMDSNGESADMPRFYRAAQKRRTRSKKAGA